MHRYLTKSFTFEAAHSLSNTKETRNNNLHGHSFHVEFTLKGNINENGMIIDLTELNNLVIKLKKKLDHSYLNDINDIGIPTLENIGNYVWNFIKKENSKVYRIQVSRKTCNESYILEL